MFAKSAYLRTVVHLVENTRVLRGVVNFFFTFLHTYRWLCKWSFQRCSRIIFRLSLWAMTGRSPKGITAQGTTLGGQWTKYFALWKSSRSQLTDNFPIPFALSERKIAIPFLPRALPRAVFLLGFQPVFARNHDCCTILCAIFLLGFCSAISGRSIVCKK